MSELTHPRAAELEHARVLTDLIIKLLPKIDEACSAAAVAACPCVYAWLTRVAQANTYISVLGKAAKFELELTSFSTVDLPAGGHSRRPTMDGRRGAGGHTRLASSVSCADADAGTACSRPQRRLTWPLLWRGYGTTRRRRSWSRCAWRRAADGIGVSHGRRRAQVLRGDTAAERALSRCSVWTVAEFEEKLFVLQLLYHRL